MSRYLVKRIGRGFVTVLISVTLTFLILRLMPGNPADVMADPHMTQELRESILKDFGLDKPLAVQYLLYLKQLATGNLGISFRSLQPISRIVMERLPWTLMLTGSAFLITIMLGIPLGVISAVRRGSLVDRTINAFAVFGNSVFIPWLAITMLYFFGYKWNLFPIGGAKEIDVGGWEMVASVVEHLVLPVATLVLTQLAQYVLFLRTSMLDVLQEDFIRTARSKGLTGKVVIYKHALKNAFLPTITMMGLQLGYLVGGAVLTETVYAYPGLGRLIYDSVLQLDYPVLQGAFILLATTVITANIVIDLFYGLLDPRIRYE
ncbi:MAG: ABC transporter permease [Firmicutes bacterium]|nr:ABC transporter permease [Bacillota bacterium]